MPGALAKQTSPIPPFELWWEAQHIIWQLMLKAAADLQCTDSQPKWLVVTSVVSRICCLTSVKTEISPTLNTKTQIDSFYNELLLDTV